MSFIIVGAGGFFGAVSRFILGKKLNNIAGTDWPLGTLAANILGCILMGMASVLILSSSQRLLFVTGFIGSFTTFSTFVSELYHLNHKKTRVSFLYVALSLFGGTVGLFAGMGLGGWLRSF